MLEAGLWGLAAASSLVVGAGIALAVHVPRRLVALVMGFGAGALISAIAFDLTAEAFNRGGTTAVGIGLATGAVAFYVWDRLLQRRDRRGPPAAAPIPSGRLESAIAAISETPMPPPPSSVDPSTTDSGIPSSSAPSTIAVPLVWASEADLGSRRSRRCRSRSPT